MPRIFQRILFSALLALSFKLSAQVTNPVVTDIPMRDGKSLKADIHLPDQTGQFPVILIQTPYSRLGFRLGLPMGTGQNISTSPYAFVVVDWRCFYGSAGACVANVDRGKDGYDVVEWIAAQSWSNGKIGMWGPSALGNIQYQTAREHPPSLDCMVPLVASPQSSYQQVFPGGIANIERIEQMDNLGFNVSGIYYANPVRNLLWQIAETSTFYPEDIQIPALLIGGWFDHNTDAVLRMYGGLQQLSDPTIKDQHRLLMGPWVHGGAGPAFVGSTQQGDLSFPEATRKNDTLALQFFDFYLRDIQNGWDSRPLVNYFQMGDRTWETSSSWPPASKPWELFFHSSMELSTQAPSDSNSGSSYNYDPNDPSPTHGGSNLNANLLQGPYDQSNVVESRSDVLIFQTEPLSQPVVVHGVPMVKLSVSSDRTDTDFMVRMTDTYPDGKSILLSDGVLRMRFRNGFSAQDTSAIIPGNIYQIGIPLPNIAHTFLPGHRIKLIISSSNYFRYNRNANTNGPMYPDGNADTLINPLVANNTVYHNAVNRSSVEFPVALSTPIEKFAEKELSFTIFPNPASKNITLSTGLLTGKSFGVRIFNSKGAMVHTSQSSTLRHDIDIQDLTHGIYFVQIINENRKSGWKKLLIE